MMKFPDFTCTRCKAIVYNEIAFEISISGAVLALLCIDCTWTLKNNFLTGKQ